MFVGGLATIEPIQERPGQVHSDDFVGCVQSVSVNGRTLNLANGLHSRGITNTCQRRRDICQVHAPACGEGGSCVDRWSNASCVCQGGASAPNCLAGLEPVSLTDGAFVEFRVSERHRRRQVLRALYSTASPSSVDDPSALRWRRRRDLAASLTSPALNTLSISFRTVAKNGVVLLAATNNDFTALRVS